MKRMDMITIGSLLACVMTINSVYAAQPEDKGKDKEPPGQARQEQAQQDRAEARVEQAQARAEQATERAETRAEQAQVRAEQATQRLEARAQQAELKAEQAASRAERAAEARLERQAEAQEHRSVDRADRRHEPAERANNARVQVASLVDSLNKLDHARWSHNPHDTRGQGNMGQPQMQDPFGFDKDSGREGQDRGRPCRGNACTEEIPPAEEPPVVEEPPSIVEPPVVEEPPLAEEPPTEPAPTFNLAEMVTVNFEFFGSYWQDALQSWIAADTAWYESLTEPTAYQTQLYQDVMEYYQYWVDYYSTFDTVSAIKPWATVDYTVNLPTTQELEGTTLLVTTRLTSLSNYDDVVSYDMTWNGEQSGWGENGWFDYALREEEVAIHYEVGDVVVEQTQEVTLGEQSTLSVSYNPPDELVGDDYGWGEGGGFFAELSVIVTDPTTGQSVTYTYDREINLYRCPYGIIYNKQTGRPIAGAIVTVHNEDGSVVLLDKAANPNVSNPQTTDATGRYNCKLATGKKYYLSVKAPGYQDYKSSLFSERWHIVREDVGMTPAIVPMLSTPPAVELPVPAVSPAAHPGK